MKKIRSLFALLLVFGIMLVGCERSEGVMPESTGTEAPSVPECVDPETTYTEALALLEKGSIEEAYRLFLTIRDFRDVSDYLSRFSFRYEKSVVQGPVREAHTSRTEYDSFGRTIFSETVYLHNSARYQYSAHYDENGRLIFQDWLRNGTSWNTIAVQYDAQGRPIKAFEGREVTMLEYDQAGRIGKVIYPNGGVTLKNYDSYGNLVEERVTNSDQETTVYVYEYNEHGDLIKSTIYEPYGSQVTREHCRYEYDEHGNKIKQQSLLNEAYDEWEYDANGNETKHLFYLSSGDFVCFYSKYDENGNVIEKRREDQNGITYDSYLEYDSYGNLIKDSTVYYKDPSNNRVQTFTGYRLYYNPYPICDLPEEIVGKG